MTFPGFLIMLVSAGLVFTLPRRQALVPLLLGLVYAPFAQSLEIAGINFSVIRLLTVAGILRVMAKGEMIAGGLNGLDRLMIAWGVCAVFSSVFHASGALTFRLGLVLDCLGAYFVFRVLVQDLEDIRNSFKIVCIPFIPVAVGMMIEKLTGQNAFAIIGGVPLTAGLRHGHFRGQGPFGHAILAGTIGAISLPMALYFWRENRHRALIGMAAGLAIVLASGSSGPAMTLVTILAALAFWRVRGYLRLACWAGVMLIIALDIVMKDPVYFLLARIDLTGGSTGWHRAALIQAAIQHLGGWWLGGTDYTRDWMPTGVYWSPNHTDITNHFLQMGVWGGLPLMLLFMACVWVAFVGVGRALREHSEAPVEDRFLIWTLGAILFGHVTSFLSVSYYDQTVVFFYLLLASIGSIWAVRVKTAEDEAPALEEAATA
jgi:hypothetical protein